MLHTTRQIASDSEVARTSFVVKRVEAIIASVKDDKDRRLSNIMKMRDNWSTRGLCDVLQSMVSGKWMFKVTAISNYSQIEHANKSQTLLEDMSEEREASPDMDISVWQEGTVKI